MTTSHNDIPEGFTLALALVDAIPVALFCASAAVLARLGQMPSLALVIAWVACMCAMGYFAGHRNQGSARDNWTEQLTNAAGQACLLAALLLA